MPNTVSERAERTAADYFRDVGELEARIDSHHDRLDAVERMVRTFDGRNQQIQVHLAALARLAESLAESISRLERNQEEQNKENRDALIAALRAAPNANKASSVIGMLLSGLALVLMAWMLLTGKLG